MRETTMQRLTPEIIEQCLRLESVEILGRTGAERFEGDGWSEIQDFRSHLLSSEKLRTGIATVICAIFDEYPESHNTGIPDDHVTDLMQSGKVTFKHLQVIEDVCRQFFFLGWHAHSAVDDGLRGGGGGNGKTPIAIGKLRKRSKELQNLSQQLKGSEYIHRVCQILRKTQPFVREDG